MRLIYQAGGRRQGWEPVRPRTERPAPGQRRRRSSVRITPQLCQDHAIAATAKELMLRGEPYDAGDPELVGERAACRALVERFNATSFEDRRSRRARLTELLGELGEAADVMSPFQCDYGYQITIGPRTFVNYGAVVLDGASVTIGADVQVGPAVQLITALHPLDPDARRAGLETAAPVNIGDGAWLAAGVIVLPGVTIGPDAVIGAGSVVTSDMPPRHLCFGNPCRAVREID